MRSTGQHRFRLLHSLQSRIVFAALSIISVASSLSAQRFGGNWTPISPLPTNLSGYTLTVLQSGNILLVGGIGNGFISNGGVIYNTLSHSFKPTAHAMSLARFGHTATLLSDGTVLVAGGMTPQPLSGCNPPAASSSVAPTNCAELYDPLTDSFKPVGAMNVTRTFHSATLIDSKRVTCADGLPCEQPTPLRVLIAGGEDGGGNVLDSLEFYNFYTQKFETVPEKLKAARVSHTATWLPTVDQILIAGGTSSSSASGRSLGTAEVFDPADNKILTTVPMVSPRVFHSATLLQKGYFVLLAGGFNSNNAMLDTAEVFDPASLVFTSTAGKMAFPQANHAAALMSDGSVLLAGGVANTTGLEAPISRAQIFNESSRIFFEVPAMQTARSNFQMGIALNSSEVLAAGGSNEFIPGIGSPSLSASEIFTPSAGMRRPRFTALDYCTTRPFACQILRERTPLVLSGMVHRSMVIIPFPRPTEPVRERKSPVSYRVAISGIGNSWDAFIVDEDGSPYQLKESDSREPLVLTLAFRDAASFEAAAESSVLVFQMTSSAAVGRQYPITVKAEVTSRPVAVSGAQKP